MADAATATRHRQARSKLLAHALLILGVLIFAFPIWIALMGSTHDASTLGRGEVPLLPGPDAVENYVTAFGDPKFWDGFGRVAVFLVVQVPVMLLLALAAALAIDSARLHAAGFYRIVIFLPYAVPAVVAVLMWGYIYGDQFGLTRNLNDLLGGQFVQPFLPEWMLLSIGNIVTWQFVGYNMLIFYSSLKTIPNELYEAASIDGAGAWRTIFSIKIPAVRGAVVIATIFSIIGSFQLFNEPNILKPLAPNTITTFFTPNMYAYNLSFAGQQYNYAATVAIIMGVITAVIAYVVQLRGSRQEAR